MSRHSQCDNWSIERFSVVSYCIFSFIFLSQDRRKLKRFIIQEIKANAGVLLQKKKTKLEKPKTPKKITKPDSTKQEQD